MTASTFRAKTGLAAFVLCLIASLTNFASAETPQSVLEADTIASVAGYKGESDTVRPIAIVGTSLPFKRALRVSRASAGENSYTAAIIWNAKTPIKKGDVLVATFYVRNLAAKKGMLNLDLTLQLNDEPYTTIATSSAPVDTLSWKKYAIPFRSLADYAAGTTSFQIRYGLIKQQFDVGGVSVVNHGPIAEPFPKSLTDSFAYYYPGRGDAKASWRKSALARIETIRKGNLTVQVVDAKGRPVKGAAVKLEQTKSSFIWGTAASAISMVCKVDPGDSNRPCPTLDQVDNKPVTPADYRKLRAALLENFNAGSFYNDLKWTDWHNDQQIALDGIAWMKRNKLPLHRGHNLIWPSFEPDYLMPRDVINRSTPPAKVKRVIADHFAQQLGVLRGQIPEWDVVNEPFSNYDIQGRIAAPGVTSSRGVIGPAEVAAWFKDARRHDPKALLFLNDYSIFENLNPTAQGYDLALVKYIKQRGGPVDGIGFQGHFGASGPVFKDMQRVINEFSPLVKTMSLTEFDFTTLDPKLQADLMDDVMTFIFSQPKFNVFQMWGFWDGDHWLGSAPLYYHDWKLKPSGAVWRKLTRQTWRTRAAGVSNSEGEYKLKAFYGTYNISVTSGGKTCKTQANFTKSGSVEARATC